MKSIKKSVSRTKQSKAYLTGIDTYLFTELSPPQWTENQNLPPSLSKSSGSARILHKEYRPFESTRCLINAGLFSPTDEKEMILKASNIFKQKLFTENGKKKSNPMLSVKEWVSQIKDQSIQWRSWTLKDCVGLVSAKHWKC